MYKSKLQELCQSKSWNLPEYIITKNGPDHYPNFGASITVNGILFQTQAPVQSSKMARNDVAKLALDHFSTVSFQQTTPQPTIATTLLSPSQPLMPVLPPQPSLPLQQQHQETSCFVQTTPQPTIATTLLPPSQPLMPVLPQQPSLPLQQQHQETSCFVQTTPQPTIATTLLPPSQPLMPVLPQQPSLPLQQQHQETSCFILFPQPSMPTQASHQPWIISPPGSLESTDVNDTLSGVPMPAQILKDKAQLNVVNAMSSVLNDHNAHKEPKRMYKHQLQHYAQKKNLKYPVYSCEREGPSHASRFKCDVTIDGKTYMSDDSFSTIKDAENEVARIALASLSQFGAQELIQDDSNRYKNLLQELTQKKKSNLPIYKSEKFGESHVPKFISTVEFEGKIFTGQESKTKKQAEISAAEVAYHAIRKRKSDSLIVANTSRTESVDNLQLNMTNEPQHSDKRNASINLNSCLATQKQGSDCRPAGDGGVQGALVSSSTVPLCHSSSPSEGTPSKRICIHPRTPNMTYPEGGVMLPMSDDKWVALSLSGNQNYSAND